MKRVIFLIVLPLSILALVLGSGAIEILQNGSENIDPDNDGSQFAYGENVGWFNFEQRGGPGVTVTDDEVTGYVWAENIGWVNLSPYDTDGVLNDGSGNLSGYGWSENVGWINFDPHGGGVTIDTTTGEFDGWAWGENIGWIRFNGYASYNVQTDWTITVDDDVIIVVETDPDEDVSFSYWVNETSYCSTQAAFWNKFFPEDGEEGVVHWTPADDYDNDSDWTPGNEGRKILLVWASDDPDSANCPAMAGISYEVGGTACFDPIDISLEEIEVEDVAYLRMTVDGAINVKNYKFWVNKNSYCDDPGNPNWEMLQDWSATNSCDWELPGTAGLPTLLVWTTDEENPDERPDCVGMGGMTYYWVPPETSQTGAVEEPVDSRLSLKARGKRPSWSRLLPTLAPQAASATTGGFNFTRIYVNGPSICLAP